MEPKTQEVVGQKNLVALHVLTAVSNFYMTWYKVRVVKAKNILCWNVDMVLVR